jgi:hypothetical protein
VSDWLTRALICFGICERNIRAIEETLQVPGYECDDHSPQTAARPRDRAEVMEAWRTSCPRLSIWEDACLDGLIDFEPGTGKVILSEAGKASLFR